MEKTMTRQLDPFVAQQWCERLKSLADQCGKGRRTVTIGRSVVTCRPGVDDFLDNLLQIPQECQEELVSDLCRALRDFGRLAPRYYNFEFAGKAYVAFHTDQIRPNLTIGLEGTRDRV